MLVLSLPKQEIDLAVLVLDLPTVVLSLPEFVLDFPMHERSLLKLKMKLSKKNMDLTRDILKIFEADLNLNDKKQGKKCLKLLRLYGWGVEIKK